MDRKFSKFYLDFIKTNFSGLNLTRITEEEEFFEKQIIDSILPFEIDESLLKKIYKLGMFVDVGFGGGFPILPAREMIPAKVPILGIDSRRKKVDAVRAISQAYSQKNIEFVHSRLESIYFNKPVFMTLKAVGDVSKMLKLFKGVKGSFVMFYKAKNFETLEPNFKNNLGFKFIKISKYSVGENERSFVLYEKITDSPIDKSLVKLSDFVFN